MFKYLLPLTIFATCASAQAASELKTECYPMYSVSGGIGMKPISSSFEMNGSGSKLLTNKNVPGVLVIEDQGLESQYNNGKYQRNLNLLWSATAKTETDLYNTDGTKLDANIFLNFSNRPGQYRTDVLVNKAGVGFISVRCVVK